jgi:hypothetical protein
MAKTLTKAWKRALNKPKSKADALVADNEEAIEWCHENGAHVVFNEENCVVSITFNRLTKSITKSGVSLRDAVREIQEARNQERQ